MAFICVVRGCLLLVFFIIDRPRVCGEFCRSLTGLLYDYAAGRINRLVLPDYQALVVVVVSLSCFFLFLLFC